MLLVFILSFFVYANARPSVVISFAAAVLCFVCAGMLRYAAFATPAPDHIVRLAGIERRLATLEGVIVSDIRHDTRSGWAFASYFPTPPQSSFYLSAQAIAAPDGLRKTTGLVRVQVAELARHLCQGDRVRLVCWLDGFDAAANPGQFDMQAYMHQQGVWLGASVPAADGVEVLARGQSGLMMTIRQRLTALAGGALLEDADYPADSAAMAAALLLGQRSDLDAATNAAFNRTGLTHIISLSGMHVALLAGSLWSVTLLFGLPKPLRAAICLALLLAYGLAVPPRGPTVRAIFLGCFFFSAVILNRQTRPLNTLALSAMVLLLVRPAELFSPSWQLSFSAVLGILVLYEPLYQRLMSWSVFKAVAVLPKTAIESRTAQWTLKAVDIFMRMMAVGLAAWLAGAGFLLYHFYALTPLSPLWTVLTAPPVTVLLYAGYLKIVLTPVFPTLGLLCGVVVDWCCRVFTAMTLLFAAVPLSELRTGTVGAGWVAVGYAALAAVRFAPRRIALAALVCLIGLFGLLGWTQGRSGDALAATCLSVGHGQAVHVAFPDGTDWLIDAGSISQKDPGGRTVLPYLRYRGTAALDAVILTHGDMDHLNGLPEIVSGLPTRGVYANASVLEKAKTSSSASYLVQRLNAAGHRLAPVAKIPLPKIADVRMLWPDDRTAADTAIDDNNKSQVIWIGFAGRSILLCGDVEQYAQDILMQRFADVTADVIVLPHHGSTVNLNPAFITHFQPRFVIASCAASRQPTAYTPPPDSGIAAFYTPIHGAVTAVISPDGKIMVNGHCSGGTERQD